MTTHAERAAHLAANPEDRTPAHLIDHTREAALIAAALPLLDPDYHPAHHAAFDMLNFAIEQAAYGDSAATAYLDAIGMDRVWAMTDALATLVIGGQYGAE